MTYKINDQIYEVDIIRKNNKNTYLRFKDGKIVVTTNRLVTKRQIEKLLQDNEGAIIRMINQYQKRKVKEEDANFYLFGRQYDIIYGLDETEIIDNKIFTKDSKSLNKFLTKYITSKFEERLYYWYDKFTQDIPRPSLRIRKMKTRWGVCNTKTKVITLNTELLKYPERCLDYVVVHELSHLIHPNHSKSFWKVVESYYPNYKEVRKELRD